MKILEFSQKVIKAVCRVKLNIFGRAPNSLLDAVLYLLLFLVFLFLFSLWCEGMPQNCYEKKCVEKNLSQIFPFTPTFSFICSRWRCFFGLFHKLTLSLFTTCEKELDCYHQNVNMLVASRVAKQLKTWEILEMLGSNMQVLNPPPKR